MLHWLPADSGISGLTSSLQQCWLSGLVQPSPGSLGQPRCPSNRGHAFDQSAGPMSMHPHPNTPTESTTSTLVSLVPVSHVLATPVPMLLGELMPITKMSSRCASLTHIKTRRAKQPKKDSLDLSKLLRRCSVQSSGAKSRNQIICVPSREKISVPSFHDVSL